ncbi:hypothetical protein M1437_02750, partial [Patescibacteria group bacterium]|nr:hypothetical protein [Patescibacteria group bacterium]
MQRFDIATFLAEEHKEKDLKRYTEKNFKKQSLSTIQDYKKVKEQIETYFEDSLEKEISEEMINLKHNAIIGEPKASKRLKDEIADYLRKFNLMQSTFPSHYPSLVEALFEDIFGLGPLSTWRNYPNSQSAQIIGQ